MPTEARLLEERQPPSFSLALSNTAASACYLSFPQVACRAREHASCGASAFSFSDGCAGSPSKARRTYPQTPDHQQQDVDGRADEQRPPRQRGTAVQPARDLGPYFRGKGCTHTLSTTPCPEHHYGALGPVPRRVCPRALFVGPVGYGCGAAGDVHPAVHIGRLRGASPGVSLDPFDAVTAAKRLREADDER